MAKTTAVHLKGKVEGLIFYERAGRSYVRTAPSRVRQSRATKASARRFGMAASMSAALRKGLATTFPELQQWKHTHPLNTALLNWLREKESGSRPTSSTSLDRFSFNKSHSLYSRLSKAVRVEWSKTGVLEIRVPALTPIEDIDAPARTRAVYWKIAAASCTVRNPSQIGYLAGTNFEMPYQNKPIVARQIEFAFPLKPGELAVVAIGLEYQVENKGRISKMADPRWLPLNIVGYVST